MGKRRPGNFRRTDALRAIRSARDAGIDPAGLEIIVAPDGTTTFRVLPKAATEATESRNTADDVLEQLKKNARKQP
jgi:hypothetical protein